MLIEPEEDRAGDLGGVTERGTGHERVRLRLARPRLIEGAVDGCATATARAAAWSAASISLLDNRFPLASSLLPWVQP